MEGSLAADSANMFCHCAENPLCFFCCTPAAYLRTFQESGKGVSPQGQWLHDDVSHCVAMCGMCAKCSPAEAKMTSTLFRLRAS